MIDAVISKQQNCHVTHGQAFACEADAQQAPEAFSKALCLLEIDQTKIEKRPSFKGKGRPKKDLQPDSYVYHIAG